MDFPAIFPKIQNKSGRGTRVRGFYTLMVERSYGRQREDAPGPHVLLGMATIFPCRAPSTGSPTPAVLVDTRQQLERPGETTRSSKDVDPGSPESGFINGQVSWITVSRRS